MPQLRIKKQGLVKTAFGSIIRYVFLLAYGYVILYPIVFLIVNSLKGPADYFDPTVQWVPKTATLWNYQFVMDALKFWESLFNTFFIQLLGGLLEIVSCAVAAYGLARFNFKGKRIFSGLMILSILVPTTMIIIPSYVNFSYLDFFGVLGGIGRLVGHNLRPSIIDTPLVFWLPSVLGVGLKGGLFIYIYAQFFKGLPRELEEAAWIDGAGPWRAFLKVIVPSSGVAFVTVSLFAVVWHWNDYYLAQMYLSESYPLSVRLANLPDAIAATSGSDMSILNTGPVLMAGCVLVILPLLVFYLLMQRKFIASISNTGIVG